MPTDSVVGRRCVHDPFLATPYYRPILDRLVGQSIGLIKTDLLPKVEGVIMIFT